MKASITTLKSMFQRGDKPTEKDFEDLIDSFLHKDEGTAIKSINLDASGNLVFDFSDGTKEVIKQLPDEIPISSIVGLQNELNSKITNDAGRQLSSEDFTPALKLKLEGLENYEHPPTHRIDEIEDLQPSLDGKVSTTANETIAGQKVFSEIVELINGLKISNFSGSGLRNLVVQADGTVDVKAIATDLFVGNTTFDDTTKILTLELVNGSTIDVDLSSLEEDLTGLRTNIAALEATTASLQSAKLDKGGYAGTAQDLDTIKRDKSSFSKSITDVSGNLELQGDQEAPGASRYYGTNGEGVKGYHEIEPIYFNVTNIFLGGSSNNTGDQEFFVDLSSYGVLKSGHQLELNNIEFRGDFSGTNEFVDVALNTTTGDKIRIGEAGGRDSSQWQSALGIGDGGIVDIIQLPTEEIGFTIYVSPTSAINFRPRGMRNWWELRADVQFKII
ncbi:hypothetical protein GCM10011344_32200 [Dokdonia pacifica]|uniref:Uncharacterized protein n=1 Tax=Dokdonia pacifica TaxID=1627892 RepID=A0A239BLT2_9FLAO|nr:hypothetical protein [Dokdonia pacifica]GGG28921.1 hypothetical protein GCM10011344_32200 [Dokdonia pacifica]SNS08351.1 hypothetical protein SAMN06265376_106247 [Dokdonia pacifica]